MKDERAGNQIVARIGFAETWLNRAKRQVADGNLARGILTLVLADAEVHHAIEVAGVPRPQAVTRVPAATLPLLLLVLAASAFGLTRSPAVPAALSPEAGAPVIALASRAGSLLRLIPAPPVAPASPAVNIVPASRPVHRVRSFRPAGVAPVTPAPAGGQVRPAVPASTPLPVSLPAPQPVVQAPRALSTPPIALTVGDLIDLVLAAERTLRGVQGH